MPFRTGPDAPRDLLALIEAEVRQRLEEAVDHACLEAIVAARRAASQPLPVADDPRDRDEYTTAVRAFLQRLREEILGETAEAQRRTIEAAAAGQSDEESRLMVIQTGLARALPEYWQRFDTLRVRFTEDYAASGRTRRGVLGRLFGRA